MQLVTDSKMLGNLIRQTRKAQGLTQEQLAAVSGVGSNFLRDVEHGKATCQIGKIIHVVSMLGLKLMIESR